MAPLLSLSRLRFRPLAWSVRVLRSTLPPVNFITLHYAYFIITCLISALIFWGSSTPSQSVSFTDSLFLCVSAMTLAGLNTVNLSQLNTWQQCMLFFLIMAGSAIFVSSFVVHVRKRAFEKKFQSVIEQRRQRNRARSGSGRRLSLSHPLSIQRFRHAGNDDNDGLEPRPSHQTETNENNGLEMRALEDLDSVGDKIPIERGRTLSSKRHRANSTSPNGVTEGDEQSQVDRVTFSPDTRFAPPESRDSHRRRTSIFSAHGVGAHPSTSLHATTTTLSTVTSWSDHVEGDRPQAATGLTSRYFPSSGYISRNSRFFGLSEAEREELGGVEYRAICFLAWVVPLYFVLFQLLGCLGLAAYVANNRPNTARANGLNPWWVGAFNGVSAFNNSGMSLLDANMTAFQTSYYMMLTMGLMILAGNTCYPIFLRLSIWAMLKLMPKSQSWDERRSTLRFLLDHPRRCYTNLFPSEHTWWLAFAVLVLNGTDWAAFEILNIGNTTLNSALPVHIRVIDGLFQAIAVRSGGFYVVSIPTLRISLQVLYVVMMYISVYPVVITMRNSNVYEERSLGIYANDPIHHDYDDEKANAQGPRLLNSIKRRFSGAPGSQEGKGYFVRQQLRAQLAHDAWWIVLAVFLIMIIEGSQFERNPAVFSVFNVIFETVSAYGTVGISVGVPDAAYSFSGAWHTLSKLVLCAVMLRGRHRGLPVAVDKAVLLPHERQDGAEEEDAAIRVERAATRSSLGTV